MTPFQGISLPTVKKSDTLMEPSEIQFFRRKDAASLALKDLNNDLD